MASETGRPSVGQRAEERANRAAQIVFDRHKFLLEDQIHLAETNRNARRTATILLVLLIGLGLFKIEQIQSVAAAPALIRWLLTIAAVCFLLGAIHLFTEKPIWRSFLRGVRRLSGKKRRKSGLALNQLNLTNEDIDLCAKMAPDKLMLLQAKEFSVAYDTLKAANYRVRGRLTRGVLLLLLGIAIAFVVFVRYIWVAEEHFDEHDHDTPAEVGPRQGSGNVSQGFPGLREPDFGEPEDSPPEAPGEANSASGSGAAEQD